MADFHDPRTRASARHSHEDERDDAIEQHPQNSDPLAELARLIGHAEPSPERVARAPAYASPAAYQPESYERESFEPEPYYAAQSVQPVSRDEWSSSQHDDGSLRDEHGAHEPDAPLDQGGDWNEQSQRWQDNAYDNFVRSRAAQAAVEPDAQWAPSAQDQWPETPSPDALRSTPAYDPYAPTIHQGPEPFDHRYDAASYHDPRHAADAANEPQVQAYGTQTSYADAPAPAAINPAAYAAPTYGRSPSRSADPYAPGHQVAETPAFHADDRQADTRSHRWAPREDTPYAANPLASPSRDAGYAEQPPAFEQGGFQAPTPYAMNSAPPPVEFYEDEGQGRRKGLVTVLAVLALAVVGTAGAFAYRTVFSGGASSSSQAPVIRASNDPTKVVPPQPEANDPSTAKLTYDRFGDRGQNEKVVPREEKPLDLNTVIRNNEPRVVLPGAPQATGANASQQALPPNIIAEPKRVKSVAIRPDAPEPAQRPQATTPLNSPGTRSAAVAPSAPPLDVTQQPATGAPVRQVVTRPVPPQASANAPLSITPDATGTAPAVPPRAAVAARTSPPAQGGYVVQVTSQRSESDAQSAYRNIQSRYSGVLNGQQSFVKRAELGDRGTYFRAMVGPFGSRAEAVQLCTSLKSAGGDCVVQSN